MFEDDQEGEKRPFDPAERAAARGDEFRMHAELAAVYEGIRKFDAALDLKFDPAVARECQQIVGRLEKQRITDTPLIAPESMPTARALLERFASDGLTTNDYHVSRRPGEIVIVRWLAGEQVDSFYQRLQAHFDAALNQLRVDEHEANDWRQDEKINAYLEQLDKLKVEMSQRYLRDIVRENGLCALSTQAADEIDILHLADRIMGIGAAELVGERSAPRSDEESERAWYFKLFSLRGSVETQERMCFVTYLQKSGDDWA